MLQQNKRKICYISVPVAPPESIFKHRLWWFEVLTLTTKQLTIFIFYFYLYLSFLILVLFVICYLLYLYGVVWCDVM